jgi:hypothetical protein
MSALPEEVALRIATEILAARATGNGRVRIRVNGRIETPLANDCALLLRFSGRGAIDHAQNWRILRWTLTEAAGREAFESEKAELRQGILALWFAQEIKLHTIAYSARTRW